MSSQIRRKIGKLLVVFASSPSSKILMFGNPGSQHWYNQKYHTEILENLNENQLCKHFPSSCSFTAVDIGNSKLRYNFKEVFELILFPPWDAPCKRYPKLLVPGRCLSQTEIPSCSSQGAFGRQLLVSCGAFHLCCVILNSAKSWVFPQILPWSFCCSQILLQIWRRALMLQEIVSQPTPPFTSTCR